MSTSKDGEEELVVGCVKSHFLDSGAFSLWTRAEEWGKANGKSKWGFYNTPAFWEFANAYAGFVKKYSVGIDLYANIDAIPNPEITWRNQRYLENTHGLDPVPVVHYKTDLKWLKHYIKRGHPIIGLGGLVGSAMQEHCQDWIARCFDLVCDNPQRLPIVKLHGFGVTSYELMIKFCWWSVDSTSWTKIGAYGGILIPHKRKGEFIFDEQPYLMKVSMDSPDRKLRGRHYLNMTEAEKAIVQEWLDLIDIPMGKMDKEGNVLELGVVTHHTYRRAANLFFYERMRKSLPKYPWPYHTKKRKGFGIVV